MPVIAKPIENPNINTKLNYSVSYKMPTYWCQSSLIIGNAHSVEERDDLISSQANYHMPW